MADLAVLLKKNRYPGRGIAMGRAEDGRAILIYFIMGRSDHSKNRLFVEKEGDIFTKAADEAKISDPSLIIYAPVRQFGNHTIVTNGDQTDTIYEALQAKKSFEEALRTRTFEPDAPHFTPRISGILTTHENEFSYKLSILKSDGTGESARRFFFEYEQPAPGTGHFIHTYQGDGEKLLSFSGEPLPVNISGGLDDVAASLWEALDEQNKISLFVRFLSQGKACENCIINRYKMK